MYYVDEGRSSEGCMNLQSQRLSTERVDVNVYMLSMNVATYSKMLGLEKTSEESSEREGAAAAG